MLRAILFDFDGVIADSEPLHLRMFQRVLERRGIPLTQADYYATYLGMDDKGCFSTLLNLHERESSPEVVEALIQEKTRDFTEVVRDHPVIFPGVTAFVGEVSRHYPLAIVSGALRHEIEMILEAAGILEAFQTIVSAEDVAEGKPNPEGFREALDRLREITSKPIRADECLVIEDSLAGLEAARKAGMICLAVTNTYPRERLSMADRIVSTLEGCRVEDLEGMFE